jgi:hypothetical protein
MGAGFGEDTADFAADPAAASGDDRHAIREIAVGHSRISHVRLPDRAAQRGAPFVRMMTIRFNANLKRLGGA